MNDEPTEKSSIVVTRFEYGHTFPNGKKVQCVCATIFDTHNKKRVLRHIERVVSDFDQLVRVRAEVKLRAEEVAAWYRRNAR